MSENGTGSWSGKTNSYATAWLSLLPNPKLEALPMRILFAFPAIVLAVIVIKIMAMALPLVNILGGIR